MIIGLGCFLVHIKVSVTSMVITDHKSLCNKLFIGFV
jgi:hypothetical protein